MTQINTKMDLFLESIYEPFRVHILNMIILAFDMLRAQPVLDLGTSNLFHLLQIEGQQLVGESCIHPLVPMDSLFAPRKLVGMFLIAPRLGVRVPMYALIDAAAGN
ncbi:MAG TPA: hypothetical protein DCF96_11355 [Rhodobacteraceae bacterium]|nr:hypothetical protein [Paracoccaceae bacterium]